MESPAISATPLYYDTDLGIDDALALAFLLASPEASIVGIGTVSGNCAAAQAARNTVDLLALAGRSDIPVASGCHDWLAAPFDGGSPEVHGSNGIGDLSIPESAIPTAGESAVDMLISLSHTYEGTLRVLAVGPFTNLAAALQRDPGIARRVHSVVVMGGAALAPGNCSPVAEANVFHDPEAARIVFAAPWPLVMVGLDVTMNHVFEDSDRLALLASDRPVARALGQMLGHYTEYYRQVLGRRATALHDPLAAAIACGAVIPTLAPTVHVEVDDTHGPGRGQTICDLRGRFRNHPPQPGAHCTVVLEIAGAFAPVLLERIVSL